MENCSVPHTPEAATDRSSLRRSYDAIADLYAANFADELDHKPFDRGLLDAFAASVDDPIVDLGCGPGQVGAYVARGGRRVFGSDFSIEALRHGRRLFPSVGFVAGDNARLPFRSQALGGVLAFYSLIFGDHSYLAGCMAEIRRVLRPGGRLLAAVHGSDGSGRYTDYEGRQIDVTITGRDPDTLGSVTRDAGLVVESIQIREPYESEHPTQRVYLNAMRR